NALIGLQEGVIDEHTTVVCNGGYYYGRNAFMRCHCSYGSINDMDRGIYRSCNTYFATTYRKIIEKYPSPEQGMNAWNEHVKSFRLGDFLGYDLPIGKAGRVPSAKTYNSIYGENRWFATNTISNAIGQGEILTTPIQLANLTAIIANRGSYFTTHIIKKIENDTIAHDFIEEKHTT